MRRNDSDPGGLGLRCNPCCERVRLPDRVLRERSTRICPAAQSGCRACPRALAACLGTEHGIGHATGRGPPPLPWTGPDIRPESRRVSRLRADANVPVRPSISTVATYRAGRVERGREIKRGLPPPFFRCGVLRMRAVHYAVGREPAAEPEAEQRMRRQICPSGPTEAKLRMRASESCSLLHSL
jgi:hypothetical protein